MSSSKSKMLLVAFFSTLAVPQATFCGTGPEIRFEHLTVEQGLPSNSVFGISQDSRGFMWFGTGDAGLCKFDGYSFTVYKHDPLDSNSIPVNNVFQVYKDGSGTIWVNGCKTHDRATGKFTYYRDLESQAYSAYASYTRPPHMHEDISGGLWFATSRGLSKFDRTSGTCTWYSLSGDTLYAICGDPDDARIFWIGTARGLDRFDRENGTFVHYDHGSRNMVNMIHGDRFGFLWMGTNEGLYRFNKVTGTFSYYPLDSRISGGPKRANVGLIYEDQKGLLWICTEAGLFGFNRATGTFREYKNDDASTRSEGRQVMSILEDRSGELWVGMLGGGLAKYDRPKDKFAFYVNDPRDPHSLSNNDVTRIFEDRSGTLWIGTWWGGLNKVDRARKAFSHYTQESADPKSLSDKIVTGLVEDRSGALWVGTMGGLNRFNRETETFTHYLNDPNNPQSLGGNVIRCLVVDIKGTIWVGTLGRGLDRLDPVKSGGTGQGKDRFIHYTHDAGNPNSLGSNYILSLFEDKSGRLWIGTRDEGLDEFDRNSGKFIHYKHDPKDPNSLGWNWVNAIYEDKSGALWVGTATEKALNKLDRATGKFTRYYWDPRNIKSLSYYSVHSIFEDSRGTLWIGTAAGLNRFDRSTETFTHFTTRDGIASDFIGAILEDDSGHLWLKTLKGVSKFDPRTGTFRNYDASDGADINPTWGKASYKNKNGEMYFGGISGFVRFCPDSIVDNPYVPPIVFTRFLVSDTLAALDTVIAEKKAIELSYDEDSFGFEFASLSYTNSMKNQYAYKLDGYDKDWVKCGTRRYASYTHLDPGTYVFRVKGSNNDGILNEEGASISIRIRPPYWQTWWFRSLMAAVIIGLLFLGHNYRVARLLEMERLRVRISTDLHDEIGSNLSAIALQSDLVRSGVTKGSQSNDQLLEISRSARQMASDLRDIVWTINPGLDHLNDMVDRMRSIASTMLGGISYTFEGKDGISSGTLEMEFRRNILLMYKEVLHNVLDHAHANQVRIRITDDPGLFTITIEDNGVGFDTSLPSAGNGLTNLKNRASSIGATLEIESAPAKGTRVSIGVEIP